MGPCSGEGRAWDGVQEGGVGRMKDAGRAGGQPKLDSAEAVESIVRDGVVQSEGCSGCEGAWTLEVEPPELRSWLRHLTSWDLGWVHAPF